MTDMELLELAAKAAGIELTWQIRNDEFVYNWNPLTDDGDALRLAVKLDMDVVFDFDRVMAVHGDGDGTCITEYFYELPNPTDIYAATRRAIVRAAAKIGKSL